MRRAARALTGAASSLRAASGALLLLLLPAAEALAPGAAQASAYEEAVRELDGGQFLEDEPLWIADLSLAGPADADAWPLHEFVLHGRTDAGEEVRRTRVPEPPGDAAPRAGELARTFGLPVHSDRGPLLPVAFAGLPAGSWLLLSARGDTTRPLARFRVVAPRGSEEWVRAALARARRLTDAEPARGAEASRLYEAVYARYPRTAYRTVVYAGMWRTRAHNRYGADPGRWLEEVFAHFHDNAFGVFALDVFVRDVGADAARPRLRRLVGLYPDTELARAAARYL